MRQFVTRHCVHQAIEWAPHVLAILPELAGCLVCGFPAVKPVAAIPMMISPREALVSRKLSPEEIEAMTPEADRLMTAAHERGLSDRAAAIDAKRLHR